MEVLENCNNCSLHHYDFWESIYCFAFVAYLFKKVLNSICCPIWKNIHLTSRSKRFSLLYFTYLFGVVRSLLSGRFSAQFVITKVFFSGLFIMILGCLLSLFMHTSLIITGLSLVCFGFLLHIPWRPIG